MKKKSKSKFSFYLPRVLTILFILFISMFALDVFGNGLGFWETLLALIMHLIPTIILTTILVLCWRKSKYLATMWLLFGVWYVGTMIQRSLETFQYYYLSWSLILAGPAFIIAYLFFRETRDK